jgi:endogenous inhibitor of DNA gyrase (YacG/DUF329 family)
MEQPIVRVCALCGEAFFYRNSPYCSPKCGHRARGIWRSAHKNARKTVVCATCGKPIDAGSLKRAYCSYKCYPKKPAPPPKPQVLRICLECGTEFSTNHNTKAFCTERCYRNDKRRKRRAIKRGCEVSKVSRYAIALRDEFVCWLCHEPVDMSIQSHHPMSATLARTARAT